MEKPIIALINCHILVADANPHDAEMLSNVLVSLGCHKVDKAKDSLDIINKLKTKKYDIVIMSIEESVMGGVSLTAYIRRQLPPHQRQVPIIMTCAGATKKEVFSARDVGVNEFLLKPYNINSLLSRINAVLNKPREFIVSEEYIGPDRRRNEADNFEGTEKRRPEPPKPSEIPEYQEMSQTFINEYFTPEDDVKTVSDIEILPPETK